MSKQLPIIKLNLPTTFILNFVSHNSFIFILSYSTSLMKYFIYPLQGFSLQNQEVMKPRFGQYHFLGLLHFQSIFKIIEVLSYMVVSCQYFKSEFVFEKLGLILLFFQPNRIFLCLLTYLFLKLQQVWTALLPEARKNVNYQSSNSLDSHFAS